MPIFFDLEKAKLYQTIKWEKFFNLIKIIRKIFSLILILLCFFYVSRLFGIKLLANFPLNFRVILSSASLIFTFFILEQFFDKKLKKPLSKIDLGKNFLNSGINVANFLDYNLLKVFLKTKYFLQRLKLEKFNTNVLLYSLLEEKIEEINFIFLRLNLEINELKKTLKPILLKEEEEEILTKVILAARESAIKEDKDIITPSNLLISLAKYNDFFKKFLIEKEIKKEDLENVSQWFFYCKKEREKNKKWWSYENLVKHGSIGKNFSAGYTIMLDKYSRDWTEIISKRGFEKIIGHQEEIKRCETILAKIENNDLILVGEPGSGRKSIIHLLATRIFLGKSLPSLNYKRVVELDLPSLIAVFGSQEAIANALDKIFKEIEDAGNIILVIDEFHNFISVSRDQPGKIDISAILIPYLSLPHFQVIAITSFVNFHKYIQNTPSLLNYFEKVEVHEISEKETLTVLENLIPLLEKKYKKFILYQTLRDIVNYSGKYIQTSAFPKKAIELLDEVMVFASRYTKTYKIFPNLVSRIVSEKTQIPVGKLEESEIKTLLNLEFLIHKRLINQEQAVKDVASSLRRARVDISTRKAPIGSFLFLGPTGVGKTELAKTLAEIYFGSEDKIIRLDMSEYQNSSDIARLIGSSEEPGYLTTKVREAPFSLLLLDEIEKAHQNILNLFLQVLDEGYLKDFYGRKVSFLNTIIIATSNAAYKIILEKVKKEEEFLKIKEEIFNYLFKKGIFRPEFINRFDSVVIFKPLNKENLLKIAGLFLRKLQKKLKQKEITLLETKELKEKIVELSYEPKFGARKMRRVIQNKLENPLAIAILNQNLKRGDVIKIDAENFNIIKVSN